MNNEVLVALTPSEVEKLLSLAVERIFNLEYDVEALRKKLEAEKQKEEEE